MRPRYGIPAPEAHQLSSVSSASGAVHKAIGVGRVPVVELGGVFDDTSATGPDALFANRVPEGPAAEAW